jgi:hypothetical protein
MKEILVAYILWFFFGACVCMCACACMCVRVCARI